MHPHKKRVFLAIIVSIAFTSLFFVLFDRTPLILDSDTVISINKTAPPEIYYTPNTHPAESRPTFTQKQKDLLYEGGIKPLIAYIDSQGYRVLSVNVRFPLDQPILLDAVIYSETEHKLVPYQGIARENADGSFSYGPEKPPNYAE